MTFAIVNGYIMLIGGSSSAGSLLAALLFLPHFALYLLLLLATIISVIIPCAIAVENIGPVVAISRFIACVRRDTGNLIVHFIITTFFSSLVMLVVSIVFMVLFFTFSINAGADIGILASTMPIGHADAQQGFDVEFASLNSHSISERTDTAAFWGRRVPNTLFKPSNGSQNSWIMERGFNLRRPNLDIYGPEQFKVPWSYRLRLFFVALVIASTVSYSAVFWIVSFTNYYRAVRPRISRVALPRVGS